MTVRARACLVHFFLFSNGNWSNVGNGVSWNSVRVLEQPPPAFLLPLLVSNDLLGMARLFSIANTTTTTTASGALTSGNEDGNATFALSSGAMWLGSGQVDGQFARIGIACECKAANRSVLGASQLRLTPGATPTTFGASVTSDADGAPLDVVNASDIGALLGVGESTTARGQPTAVLRAPAGKDYLFVDLYTQTSEQGTAVYNSTSIAVGSLATPPLNVARGANGTLPLDVPLRATATLLVGSTAYLYFDTPSFSSLAKVDVDALAGGGSARTLALSYFQSISLTNASSAVWVANVSDAGALNFGCSIRSLFGQRALCVAPLETQSSSNLTRNALQYFELLQPWTRKTDVVPLLTSAWGAPFVSASWHAETLAASSVWLSTVSAVVNVTEAMPHTLNTPSFHLLEFRS